jgi:hypothetical protein
MNTSQPEKAHTGEPAPPTAPTTEEKSTQTDSSGSPEDVQPLSTAVRGPPFPSNAAVLPTPPPVLLSVYQIVPGPSAHAETAASLTVISQDATPGPGPLTAVPAPDPTGASLPPAGTKPKTNPRTIHECYDQHSFQWREFDPNDTVVGDETDPFIVYFRHASKSIGSRKEAFILPKHPHLIRIMQDCLPDYDWRTGEDMFVFPHNKVEMG